MCSLRNARNRPCTTRSIDRMLADQASGPVMYHCDEYHFESFYSLYIGSMIGHMPMCLLVPTICITTIYWSITFVYIPAVRVLGFGVRVWYNYIIFVLPAGYEATAGFFYMDKGHIPSVAHNSHLHKPQADPQFT